MRKISTLPNSGGDTADYPFGFIKDAGGVVPGTPVVEQTYSDVIQSILHFLTNTSTAPNGQKDNTTNGFQIFNAIEKYLEPVGTIKIWPSTVIPAGWMLCDGSLLSPSEYPELFSLVGYSFGETAGSFGIPYATGNFVLGYDPTGGVTVGQTGGSATFTLDTTNLPAHKHNILGVVGDNGDDNNNTYYFAGGNTPYPSTGFIFTNTNACQSEGGGQEKYHLPPYVILPYIIKVKYNQIR